MRTCAAKTTATIMTLKITSKWTEDISPINRHRDDGSAAQRQTTDINTHILHADA